MPVIRKPKIEVRAISESMYFFRYEVAGAGEFPFDMLRWDEAFPNSPDDAANLQDYAGWPRQHSPHRTVTLCSRHRQKHWLPEIERWRSFGWFVVNEEPEG